MSERLGSFLTSRQRELLKEVGQKGNQWREILDEASGSEEIAQMLVEVRGVEQLGGTPPNEKPRLEGSSPRVAAQRHAAKRQG